MKISLGCDHGAYELKEAIKSHLDSKSIEYEDFGCYGTESVDYPIFAYKAASAVASRQCTFGILCCTTGLGISMAANKVKGIRAAVCTSEHLAEMSRRHNNANCICIGAAVVSKELAFAMIDTFLSTQFDGGRHQRRLDEIAAIENGEILS